MKKRYVLIGSSYQGAVTYALPLSEELKEYGELVGIFDPNPLRSEAAKKVAGVSCPSYVDFDRMISETRPDCGIITTIDQFHHEYIIRCLEAGIDAITEKPMTTDEVKCRAILDAEKRTGRKVTVTFNYRFNPYAAAVKQAIRDGAVGKVLSVDFEWLLDTVHGADYFRRWHRRKENSGGLLVHKATHHFDLVNWWIDEEPVEVTAFGTRRFYGPTRDKRGERCLTCKHAKTCEFAFDMNVDEYYPKLYLDCESSDGYYRDRCVFADDIDIEDSMSVNVRYNRGTLLSYSLIAHSPYEGWKLSISGTDGRLEAQEFHRGMQAASPTKSMAIYNRKGQRTEITMPSAPGSHEGADERLRAMIFIGGIPDPLGQQAGAFAGAISILVGVAANKSMAERRCVRIDDLVPLDEYRNVNIQREVALASI